MCFGVEEMSNVCVAVRVRPLTRSEEDQKAQVIVGVTANTIQVTNLKVQANQDYDNRLRVRQYAFDFCYWSLDSNHSDYASQESIYEDLGSKVLDAAFEGFNACLLAYGQSGSGKTYTMMGSNGNPGLTPRICQGLFEKASTIADRCKFRTEVSFLEIYNERVRDLLSSTPVEKKLGHTLRVREHPKLGPCVQELSKHVAANYFDVQALIDKGVQKRSMAATKMHSNSSRSHAIFTIILSQAKNGEMSSEVVSKIHLVDLAGSERSSVHTSKVRLKEGSNINKSLVALGSVICALGSPQRGQTPFVPYRDSVLTWLLKDSLGGNSKTIMVATISPSNTAFNETLSTLRYANQAKSIVNKPIINEDPNVTLVRELRAEITRLREMLTNFENTFLTLLSSLAPVSPGLVTWKFGSLQNKIFDEPVNRIRTSDAEINCDLINEKTSFKNYPTDLKRRSSFEDQMKNTDRHHCKRQSLEIVASFDKILEMHFNLPKNNDDNCRKPPPGTILLNPARRNQPDSLSEAVRSMQVWPIYLTGTDNFRPALVAGSDPPAKSRDSASQTGGVEPGGPCQHATHRKVTVVAKNKFMKRGLPRRGRQIRAKHAIPKSDKQTCSLKTRDSTDTKQHSARGRSKRTTKLTPKRTSGSGMESIHLPLDRTTHGRTFTQLLVCDICLTGQSSHHPAPLQQSRCHWPQQLPSLVAVASATLSLDTTTPSPATTRNSSSQTTIETRHTETTPASDHSHADNTNAAEPDFRWWPTADRILDMSRHFRIVPARNRSTQTPELPERNAEVDRWCDQPVNFVPRRPIDSNGTAGVHLYDRWTAAIHARSETETVCHGCNEARHGSAHTGGSLKTDPEFWSLPIYNPVSRFRAAESRYMPTTDAAGGRLAGDGGRHYFPDHSMSYTAPANDGRPGSSRQLCDSCRKPVTSTPAGQPSSAEAPRHRPRKMRHPPQSFIVVTFEDENSCLLNEYLKLPWTLRCSRDTKNSTDDKNCGSEKMASRGFRPPPVPVRSARLDAAPASQRRRSSLHVDRWVEKQTQPPSDICCDATCDYDIMALLAECNKVRQAAWQQIVGMHRGSDVINHRVTVSACGIDNSRQ